jgi:RHS repeat-associated protein
MTSATVSQNPPVKTFAYDVIGNLLSKSPEGTTTFYFDAFGVHAELISNGTPQWNEYLTVGGTLIGMRVLRSGSGITTRYLHTDNLGSIAIITDETGAVVERDSYDAWGKRRFPTGADDPSGGGVPPSQTTRGFTGQEELADVGLVHLNGRVYDPLVGRMMSADPMVPDPLNSQAWNRYSYVINNPLAFTDPNGYCFLGMCSWGRAVSTFFGRSFGVMFRKFPILGDLLEIGAVLLCGMNPVCAIPVAFASTTFVAGVTSGNLGYALKAGFIAGITALANFDVGLLGQALGGPGGYLLNAAGKALVGCGMSVASGGKCGAGALAGGVSALASPLTNGPDGFASLVMNSVVGGLASVAGGGKFANGAVTGAFAYLFSPDAGLTGNEYGAESYDKGRAAEDLWLQAAENAGENVIGRQLYYEFLDADGNPVLNADGSRRYRIADGLKTARDGITELSEVKNGPDAKFRTGALEEDLEYIRKGQIRFFGKAAEDAGIAGKTLAEISGGQQVFRFYVGPAGAYRATRQYFRFMFRGAEE